MIPEISPRAMQTVLATAADGAFTTVDAVAAEHAELTVPELEVQLEALRLQEFVTPRFAYYAPGRIDFGGAFVDLPKHVDEAVQRWWDVAEIECARPFELMTRSLQRDVAELADAVAPSLTLEGVRRRAIIDAYLAGGSHSAASFARTSNASEVRRMVEADEQAWIPGHAAPAARGPAPASVGTRRPFARGVRDGT